MRATGGHLITPTRRKLTGVGLASVLVLSILGAGTVAAATPNWTPGFGTDSAGGQPTSGASSTFVSAGKKVGFVEWLRNDDTSNISQLFVTATTKPAAGLVAAKWTIKSGAGVVRSGLCPTVQPFKCGFGALNAGQTVYVTFAFTVPSLADGKPFDLDLLWSTTGVPPGKNNSHGDAKPWTDRVTVTTNGDAAGDFNIDATTITVADDQKLTGQNRQATSASVFASPLDVAFTGVAVGDGANFPAPPCDNNAPLFVFPTWFSCSLLTSSTSVVEVGNGKTFQNASDGPGIKVLISFSQSPNQLGGDHPFVYHYWETLVLQLDGTTKKVPNAELITEECDYEAGLPTNETSCLTVGNKNVTVWLFHNGPMRS